MNYSVSAVRMAAKLCGRHSNVPDHLIFHLRDFVKNNEKLVAQCELILQIRATHPLVDVDLDVNEEKVVLHFEDMAITDPFTSECGRFELDPSYYGLSHSLAKEMVRVNA